MSVTNATWNEINFSEALWTIPKERMKRRNPHLVFLSRQAMDIMVALKTFAGSSDFILPSRYDSDAPMSSATLNCSGQQKLATALEFFQYRFSDSFGGNPPL